MHGSTSWNLIIRLSDTQTRTYEVHAWHVCALICEEDILYPLDIFSSKGWYPLPSATGALTQAQCGMHHPLHPLSSQLPEGNFTSLFFCVDMNWCHAMTTLPVTASIRHTST